jgi:transposase
MGTQSTEPTLGLGAAALVAWLDEEKKTATWLAEQIDVSKATVHDWLHAGWFKGGAVPRQRYRVRIQALTKGKVAAGLFEKDDERRFEKSRESDPPTPEAP